MPLRILGFLLVASCFMSEISFAQVGFPRFDDAQRMRDLLVKEVLIPGGITDERVIESFRLTARHEFVPPAVRAQAYYDRALPIGASQTISSPYIVAVMTQELDTNSKQKVLEIGTGSGFQAAILAPLVKEVYSIEIVPELGQQAARVLKKLQYNNVFTKVGDGFKGWAEHAPFDRIIVTCSPESVPQPLVDQLAEDGLMIIPVGERYQQTLTLMRKRKGKLEKEALRPTLFVPMTGTAENNRKVQPDPARPQLLNGTFEEPPSENGYIPGWYYQRGLSWKRTDTVDDPSGVPGHHVAFENGTRGSPTNLLQGLALDGSIVKRIALSTVYKMTNVQPGTDRSELPAVTIRFFDDNRGLLGTRWIGPFRGTTRTWKSERIVLKVPRDAKEAIVSIGLFGGTGKAQFDNVKLEAM